jgi:hypothetical protein
MTTLVHCFKGHASRHTFVLGREWRKFHDILGVLCGRIQETKEQETYFYYLCFLEIINDVYAKDRS